MSSQEGKLAAGFAAIVDIVKAFFGINSADSVGVGTGKVITVAIKRVVYAMGDYWLAGLCAATNVALKVYGVNLLVAFAVMWTINIVIAFTFLVIYLKTGQDLSLGEDLRRASDAIHSKSRIAGYLSMAGVVFQAIFWSGPEQVVIFFQKEIGSVRGMVVTSLFLTAIQTVIWMYLYRTGYDLIS